MLISKKEEKKYLTLPTHSSPRHQTHPCHTLTVISVHSDTLHTIFGRAFDGLTLNANALNLRVDHPYFFTPLDG